MAPVHGHGPIPFMAMAPFLVWPWPWTPTHGLGPIAVAPPLLSRRMSWRMACASPPRGFRLNRSIPGIKIYWR